MYAQNNLIVNPDFESGNTGFYSDYTYVSSIVEAGQYAIDNTTANHGSGNGWPTLNGSTGRYMLVNGFGGSNNPNKVVWTPVEPISVVTNTYYTFSCRVVNLNVVVQGQINPAKLQLKINGEPVGNVNQLPSNNDWHNWTVQWYSGTADHADIQIVDMYTGNSDLGDDYALDDMSFMLNAAYSLTANSFTVQFCGDITPIDLNSHYTMTYPSGGNSAPPMEVKIRKGNYDGWQTHINLDFGTATVGADNRITYTPNANFYGQDSFQYKISRFGLESYATITVNVGDMPSNCTPQGLPANNLLCISDLASFNPSATWEANGSNISSSGWLYKKIGVTDWEESYTFLSYVTQWGGVGEYSIRFFAENSCGMQYSESYNFNIVSEISEENITFADPNVKAICVANWDTNGDGELSYDEAAAVTDLGQVFRGNTEITSFEELQYFTGLTWIGIYAFSGCSGLTSLTIPNSVTSIVASAFSGCSGLTSLTIPNSVTFIGYRAFEFCSGLEQIIVDEDNPSYDSRENCNAIIETSTNTLITGCKNTFIPNFVTSIGDYAFGNCSGLTSLTIPNSVTSIGNEAFYYCNGLTSIEISDAVTSIGNSAFRGCSGLTSLTIPNSVTSIDGHAFCSCSGLTSLDIPNSVTSIGGSTFYGCYGLTSLTIPISVTSIGDYAFGYCSGLSTITVLAETPPSLGSYVFKGVEKTIPVYVPCSSISEYQSSTGWNEFTNYQPATTCASGEITVTVNPTGGGTVTGTGYYEGGTLCTLTAIPNEGFSFLNWTENGTQVSTNPHYTFTVSGNRNLVANFQTQYTINTSANPAYGGTVMCSKTMLAEDFNNYNVGNHIASAAIVAGHDYWTTWNELPGSSEDGYVENLNGNKCGHLTYGNDQVLLLGNVNHGVYDIKFDIIVPQGKNGFFCIVHHFAGSNSIWAMQCYLHLTNDGQTTTSAPGHGTLHAGSYSTADLPCVYDQWMHFRIHIDTDNDIAQLYYNVIGQPENMYAEWQWSLDSLGEAVTDCTIDALDFFPPENNETSEFYFDNIIVSNQTNSFAFGDICNITASPDNGYTFDNWTENGAIVSNDAEYSFTVSEDRDLVANFYSNNAITFADANVKAICVANWDTNGDGELSYDEAAAVTDLGGVFSNNSTITSFDELQYFTGLTSISINAFSYCIGLTSIIIPNSVTSINNSAFFRCSNLTSIVIPNAVTSIGNEVFYNCSLISDLEIPNSVTNIGLYAFYGCSGLTSVTIPNSVTSMGSNPFICCSGLEQIIVEPGNSFFDSRDNSNAIINTSSNSLISGCKNTVIPNSVISIDCAFCGCSELTSISIPNSVTTIGFFAFDGCRNLTSITIPASVTSIRNSAFRNCSSFTSISIPNTVTTIGDEAFRGCSGLTEIVMIGTTPPSLGSYYAFSNTNNCPIYVPYESQDAYKTATNWNDYEDRIFPMAYTTVAGYGEGEGNYRFIASPLVENTAPTTVDNMITETPYDLYRFDQSEDAEWQNYKAQTESFVLENGQGYLYANADEVNVIFKGEFNEDETKEVELAYEANADFAGWNLVGNPFPVSAYANRSYYTMNEAGTAVEPNMVSSATAIPTCTGVMVKADDQSESVVFNTTAPETASNKGSVQIALSQVVDRGGVSTGSTTLQDKAIVSFNAGDRLEKFVFNKDNARISIPQGGKDLGIACAEKQGEMPLNFKATKDGTYTLSVDVESADVDYLHLIDNLMGADVDLLVEPNYTFEAKSTDYASRFRLVFSVCGDADGDNGTFAFISNGNIIVTGAEADAVLQIVDVTGRVLVSRKGDAMNRISTNGMTPGVYVLRLIHSNDVKTQKIVID